MNKKYRLWMGIAALLLIGIYFFPIWSISLEAPQYPEGIGLNIYIDNIEGKAPQDLQNINGLNHYIGMKPIQPDSIPELRYMPPIVAFLIVSGLVIAVWGNRKWILAWLILFALLAVVGLIDFYMWEYDYGHDLDPNAAIKIPGMSYQPPLIGSKKILNFYATSLPHTGFFFALASMGLAGFTWWKSHRSGKGSTDPETSRPQKTHDTEKKAVA